MRNVELKARVNDVSMVIELASALTSEGPSEVLKQHDVFFSSPNGRLKLRNILKGSKKSAELIFYDRPDDDGPKLSEFVRVPVEHPQILRQVLEKSMGVIAEVRKKRMVYIYNQTRIHIDHVEGLGSFIELEVCLHENQTVEEGQRMANEIAAQLCIDKCDLVRGSYMDLLHDCQVATADNHDFVETDDVVNGCSEQPMTVKMD
ncbi:hypothetical protein AB6A40_008767 [Gnathostoma spinigerum]|uniref:CYTH domain-containing protein n=1 Tax=Gnathostoma spinigerum TaxID=75299 RepID=A0ABD6EQ26_9BILA